MMYNPPTNITGWWCTLQESSVTERRRAGSAVPIRSDPWDPPGVFQPVNLELDTENWWLEPWNFMTSPVGSLVWDNDG